MDFERDPEEYTEAKAKVVAYCYENDLIFPLYEYPFVWPHLHRRSPSPEDYEDIFPTLDVNLDEKFEHEEDQKHTIERPSEQEDHLDTRKANCFRHETPLLPARSGPESLRSYGPRSLKQSAVAIHKECITSDEGLNIPSTLDEMVESIQRDSRMTVAEGHVAYLREIISKYNNEKGSQAVYCKVVHY